VDGRAGGRKPCRLRAGRPAASLGPDHLGGTGQAGHRQPAQSRPHFLRAGGARERAAYALNEQELGIWRTAIVYASQYDHRQITLADYRQRTAALFKDYNVRR
jgi:hypothetical protein